MWRGIKWLISHRRPRSVRGPVRLRNLAGSVRPQSTAWHNRQHTSATRHDVFKRRISQELADALRL